jgi:hypothetical protein
MSLLAGLLNEEVARVAEPRREIWIAARSDAPPAHVDGTAGAGARSDPFDGSTPDRFDAAMRSSPANARIHIGPGSFPTRGGTAGDFDLSGVIGWTPKPGQKFKVPEYLPHLFCFTRGTKLSRPRA